MSLAITNTTFFKNNHQTMIGNGNITFNDVLTINVAIYDGGKGPSVIWPSDKYEKDGQTKYKRKVMFPIEEGDKFSAIENEYNDQIIDAWNSFAGKQQAKATGQGTSTRDRVSNAKSGGQGQSSGGQRRATQSNIPF